MPSSLTRGSTGAAPSHGVWIIVLISMFMCGLPAVRGQLVDKPLSLPGRPPRPQASVSAAAAGAGAAPAERYGYFSPASAPDRKLFYWFYQARNMATGAAISAPNTPVIAWFNGGPGCSSLWGMFFENGPYTLNATLQLVPNPLSWVNVGHLIYVDQPIGTGLSYSTKAGDSTSSELDVAKTIVSFFEALFKAPAYSRLANNPFYLTGESFAGHYLPSIGAYMKLNAPSIKLTGIAMGNPCTNGPATYQSYLSYAMMYGLADQSTINSVSTLLASCKLQSAVCSALDRDSCGDATRFCESQIWGGLINGVGALSSKNPYNVKDTARDCGGYDPTNCYGGLDARSEAYLNSNKAKLGVPAGITYQACSDTPFYALLPDMAASYDDLVAALVDSDVSVLVYSGEDDFVCNWVSSKQWLDGLIWSKQGAWASAPLQSWVGGTFKRAGPLSFVRIANAGHMVPLDQPALSLQLLKQWIAAGQPQVARTKSSAKRRTVVL